MATPSPSATGTGSSTSPTQYRTVGVCLAIGSGVLIGSSFVFKKKGLLRSQQGHVAGEGVAYLKSPMWWTGMTIMILGELCNFAAYAFVEAIIVTPLGALSVVISSLLSHFLLDEKLSLFGWISCVQCLIGASILALNGPEEQSVTTILDFRHLFVTPWFLTYAGVIIIVAVVLAVWVAPKYGQRTMLPYIGICSLIGGISVSCTQALGACILTSIRGDNQFKNWFTYFLLVLVVITLLTEIYYLNVALAMFNTAMVTPTYYVTFTFCTLVTSMILYKGLKASATQIMTVVLAFFVICTGIFILQMSKVDPRKLSQVDEHTTLLLEAARQEADPLAARKASLHRTSTLRSRPSRRSGIRSRTSSGPAQSLGSSVPQVHLPPHITGEDDLEELDIQFDDVSSTHEIVQRSEEPGIDSLRGTFGAIGTIIRAKRRARALSAASHSHSEASNNRNSEDFRGYGSSNLHAVRPSWLSGPWSTPKSSRFQAMELPEDNANHDVEKGQVRILEKLGSPEKGVVTPGSQRSTVLSESPSSMGQDNAIQLHTIASHHSVSSAGAVLAPSTVGSSNSQDSKLNDEDLKSKDLDQ